MSAFRTSSPGSLVVTYVGHATAMIELDGARLLTDPVLRERIAFLRRQGPSIDPDAYSGCDAVLLSHGHADHLDLPSLRLVGRASTLVAPPAVARILRRRGLGRVEELLVGRSLAIGGVTVTATPAAHGRGGGACVGFLIEGSHRVYFAGDTDLFGQMADLSGGLDAALLPIGGWGPTLGPGHLCPARAAEALTLLRPRTAVPIHWGTLCPIGFGWARPRYLVEPGDAFAWHATRLAPSVDVRVLRAGVPADLSR